MSKQEYNEWIEQLKLEGYDEDEIEEIVQSYLEQCEE